jgi:zinc/manganese transport system substrate-binding protein
MPSRRAVIHSAALLAVGALVLPGAGAGPARAAGEVKVVASFSILADLVRAVGGDRVAVTVLVPVNGDVHVYQPMPADSKAIAEARLVVFNGLGLEGWSARLVKAAAYKGPLLTASDGIAPRKADEEGDGHEAGHGHHEAFDPHAWQDVRNVRIYVANIAAALGRIDPDGKAGYDARAAAYDAKLAALDAEIRAAYAAIPARQRRVITTHDAFGYYGAAYGITFLAPQGTSTDTEASAKDVARLIRQIKAENIKAIFVENITDPRLIQRIAAETGAKLGGALFSDALSGPGGPAASYLAMMRHNLALLSAAMRGGA